MCSYLYEGPPQCRLCIHPDLPLIICRILSAPQNHSEGQFYCLQGGSVCMPHVLWWLIFLEKEYTSARKNRGDWGVGL